MIEFEDIRPFNDDEVNASLQQLVGDLSFQHIIKSLYPSEEAAQKILQLMATIQSADELQGEIMYPLLENIQARTTDGIFVSQMDMFNPEERYLFISNHRDIILDSAFLNVVMHKNGFSKTEIAIGDNLLIYNWIKLLVRLNRTFIVKRNLGIREQLSASQKLSAYIRYALIQKQESVWIAQREGRTKDGNDQTQSALLKMLNMSNKGSISDGFRELNIVPMAISYEIEPCAKSKVEELLNRKHTPDFAKTQQDDLKSMANGITQPKGRVSFGFGNPLNIRIDELTQGKSNNKAIQSITQYIDKRIYANYKLWPNNYIAADILSKNTIHNTHYTSAEKDDFVERMNKAISDLDFDRNESEEMYLNIYATPVFNYEKHFGNV
ncbi:MAG: 1-acyl-sn-glycerol-3-phosphate acyltransferase [Prolixibacteraceae bacterium]|jgi:hypothetical protein|nr:1-acyl-sn-glycerol-3-phosphate acyltransferase [Prolixibacteraceae bacterium]